jgi:hypothetical protein
MTTYTLDVLFSQIAMFDSRLASPFNDWTDEHVAQGFSWRPGSVSFATLEAAGPILIRVSRLEQVDWSVSAASRIIAVPFTVPSHGSVEVATITGSIPLQLPPGDYELTFEHGRKTDGTMTATFHFRCVDVPVEARLIRSDPSLSPGPALIMTAVPA